jgi:ubiquinone/menaquinone biosynthesis C-methylase UbiE
MPPLNYNPLAPTYHQRYEVNPLPGVAAALQELAQNAAQILEVGCGTGHWLSLLSPRSGRVLGLDYSPGMLRQAQARDPSLGLVNGEAGQLPFPAGAFDLVFCVNALHHFPHKQVFLAEARRLLRRAGRLAIVNMDPHTGRDRWYLYDYFEGTREADLRRFPSSGTLVDWLIAAGFEHAHWRVAQHIQHTHLGRAVLDDHFLQKHGTSQLALLSEAVYEAGWARLKADLDRAEAAGATLSFESDLSLVMVTAQRP